MAQVSRLQRVLADVGHEIKHNPPKILGHTRRKFGAKRAEKQRRAILLSKARNRGHFIPERSAA